MTLSKLISALEKFKLSNGDSVVKLVIDNFENPMLSREEDIDELKINIIKDKIELVSYSN